MKTATGSRAEADEPNELDILLATTVASCFPGSRVVNGNVVKDLGFGKLKIECILLTRIRVEIGYESKDFFIWLILEGGLLGKRKVPIFWSNASEKTAEAVIENGGRRVSQLLRSVLMQQKQGLLPEDNSQQEAPQDGSMEGETSYAMTFNGTRCNMVVAEWTESRNCNPNDYDDADDNEGFKKLRKQLKKLRKQLAIGNHDPFLKYILGHKETHMPPLRKSGISYLVELTIAITPENVTRAVFKVNGKPWPLPCEIFENANVDIDVVSTEEKVETANRMAARRHYEVAFVTPTGVIAPLNRDVVDKTLYLTSLPSPCQNGMLVSWRGWRSHGGAIGKAATESELKTLEEDIGLKLPMDYRQFLKKVQLDGAGPGYGLISPLLKGQKYLCRGRFGWKNNTKPYQSASGVLLLAHAGCGIVWVLVVEGPHKGEVWVNSRSCFSDGKVHRVAKSFTQWYRDWIDAVVWDDDLFAPWDASNCHAVQSLGPVVQDLKRKTEDPLVIADTIFRCIRPGCSYIYECVSSDYFNFQDRQDPCVCCYASLAQFGVQDMFLPGKPPRMVRGERTLKEMFLSCCNKV